MYTEIDNKILGCLNKGLNTIPDMIPVIYGMDKPPSRSMFNYDYAKNREWDAYRRILSRKLNILAKYGEVRIVGYGRNGVIIWEKI